MEKANTQTTTEVKTPFEDGYDAGMRVGPYEGYKTCPPNPYKRGSEEYKEWDEGFSIATDHLWYGDYYDEGNE